MVMAFSQGLETEARTIALALQRKDPEFLSRLVAQYHYRLLRYLIHLTARPELAEDLVQETWLHVLERAAQYNGRSRFEPWIFSIARNLAIDDLRRRMAVNNPAPPDAERVLEFAASDTQSPFLAAAKSEDAVRIAAAMGALEPIYREALLLRFQEDLSLEEIAQVAGAPVSTVSSRIYRGLAMLRSQLEGSTHAV